MTLLWHKWNLANLQTNNKPCIYCWYAALYSTLLKIFKMVDIIPTGIYIACETDFPATLRARLLAARMVLFKMILILLHSGFWKEIALISVFSSFSFAETWTLLIHSSYYCKLKNWRNWNVKRGLIRCSLYFGILQKLSFLSQRPSSGIPLAWFFCRKIAVIGK